MTNRSRTEIVSQILESADRSSDDDDGVTKTKIMHKVFLTSAQLKEYLMMLTENDLLGYDSATRKFKTTQKGHRFLEIYNQLDDMIKAPPAQPSPLLPTTTSSSSSLLQEQQQEQVS
jgi:predicted transcriptional regulator